MMNKLIDKVLRLFARLIVFCLYRFRVSGQSHIPTQGAAILACNHVSFIDAILLQAASPRPLRFMMDYRIFAQPALAWFFKLCRAIPIAPKSERPDIYEQAFESAHTALQNGELLAIFPEGAITRDGQQQAFKPGILKILERHATIVIPAGIHNMWGSFFSRIEGTAMRNPWRRGWRNRVAVSIGNAIDAQDITLERLSNSIANLAMGPSVTLATARLSAPM